MLQFTQKLWRLETMKISKFLWLVLVVFATIALIAPQQVEAIIVDGRVGGQVVLTGNGTITESSGISSSGINGSGINELDFNGQLFPHGPLSVTGATDDFAPVMGSQATFDLAIRWTGSDSSVTLLDVLPGAGGPAWNAPILGANGFATGTFFTLKSATFDEDSLTLIGMGTTQLTSGNPLVQKHSPARIVIQGTGQDFTYDLTVVTTALPEGGSGLGLLAIGLVAVEGLRRMHKKSIPDLICPALRLANARSGPFDLFSYSSAIVRCLRLPARSVVMSEALRQGAGPSRMVIAAAGAP